MTFSLFSAVWLQTTLVGWFTCLTPSCLRLGYWRRPKSPEMREQGDCTATYTVTTIMILREDGQRCGPLNCFTNWGGWGGGCKVTKQCPSTTAFEELGESQTIKSSRRSVFAKCKITSGIIVRLRTGHCGLNANLQWIGVSDTSMCERSLFVSLLNV